MQKWQSTKKYEKEVEKIPESVKHPGLKFLNQMLKTRLDFYLVNTYF